MKIGEAHRTQASSLYSATPTGAPMHPAPIVMADRTRNKKIRETLLAYHAWSALPIGGGRHQCANISKVIVFGAVRLTYFHANRLLTGLYKQETEIL
jgi:hypothetical protein